MPTLPVDQPSRRLLPCPSLVVKPFARPFSQSMTAFGASCSGASPTVGQPCDRPVPGASECTTAKPRGTHVVDLRRRDVRRASAGTRSPAATSAAAARRRLPGSRPRETAGRPTCRRSTATTRRCTGDLEPFGLGLPRPRHVDEHRDRACRRRRNRTRSRPTASAESTASASWKPGTICAWPPVKSGTVLP